MRREIFRRVVFLAIAAIALSSGALLARRAVHMAVAHLELAHLNEELDAHATFDQDTLSPQNVARSEKLLRAIHQANRRASLSRKSRPTNPPVASSRALVRK